MDWNVVLSGASGAALFAGIFSLIQWLLNRRASRADKIMEKQEKAEERAAMADKNLNEKVDALCVAVRELLYDRIKHLGKSYLERGSITTEELNDFINMHTIYHNALNGNGFLDEIVKQVKGLPIKEKQFY